MTGRTFLTIPATVALLAATFVLAGCNDESATADIPGPIAMTEEAVGHYCNMNILEHTGPKAQIHIKNLPFPVWFSQVRDAVAFLRLPEETQEPVAIYVNDMGAAKEWSFPGDDTWIDINKAFFVIDSRMIGGMGAPETIPFAEEKAAELFAAKNGGKVVVLADIPDDYVLGPVDLSALQNAGQNPEGTPEAGAVN
ncbi:MAG: nitrous oxide reductase accessory protein NosL [Stappiaceae bacterium]